MFEHVECTAFRCHFSPVGLVKHHVLHVLQLEVHLLDDVHQTTRGTNDSEESHTLWDGVNADDW